MWKELTTLEDFNSMVLLKQEFGCYQQGTGILYRQMLTRKTDCHYYRYKSDTIELLKGYKELNGKINLITYTIKANIEDYPEAVRLMAEHAKEYISSREIKTLVIYYGSEDEEQMNSANIGVGKIGYGEFMKIVIEEYEKLGFKTTFGNKFVSNVLM